MIAARYVSKSPDATPVASLVRAARAAARSIAAARRHDLVNARRYQTELEAARDLCPGDGFYHFWLGDLYARQGRYTESITELRQAVVSSPEDAYYSMRLGLVYLNSGRLHEAVTALRTAIDIAPQNASYHSLLGDTYVRLGYEREALMQYRHAGTLDPYDSDMIDRVRQIGAPEAA